MEKTIRIDALTYGAAGIGRDADGKAVFVERTAPGDTVRVAVDEDKKSYETAHVLEIVEPGAARTVPACAHQPTCGGCPWGHVAYGEQLRAKRQNTVDQLVKVARYDRSRAEELVAPCVPSKRQTGYRNKIELAVGADAAGRLQLGFHREGAGGLEVVDSCPLAHRTIQRAPKSLRGALRYLAGSEGVSASGEAPFGLFRVGVRTSLRTHSTQVALWTKPGPFPRKAAAKTLSSTVRATSIVRVLADPGKARAIKGVEVLSGEGRWHEQIADIDYAVSAPSFFQVNTAQAEKMVKLVVDGLQLDEESRVADLYAGVGTFTIPLYDAAGEVLAVESAGSSVRDLRRNADENGCDIEVIGGDSARELPEMGRLDALVVDPPRTGLAKGVAQSIAAAGPKRVAYVSCNPSTWARDAVRLETCGYALERATPVDLFPQTYHNEVESIFRRL